MYNVVCGYSVGPMGTDAVVLKDYNDAYNKGERHMQTVDDGRRLSDVPPQVARRIERRPPLIGLIRQLTV